MLVTSGGGGRDATFEDEVGAAPAGKSRWSTLRAASSAAHGSKQALKRSRVRTAVPELQGVIPESLDITNEGHAQLIQKTPLQRGSARRSAKDIWKATSATVMDRHTRKWLGSGVTRDRYDESKKKERMETMRQAQKAAMRRKVLCIPTIHPTGNFHRRWDSVQIVLLIYLSLVIPFKVAFESAEPEHPERSWMFWFDAGVDFYFVIDVVVNFRTAYYDIDGEFVYWPPRRLASHYVKSWFTVDLLSCLPINYLPYILADDSDTTIPRSNKAFRLLRMFRLFRLFRLMKLKSLIMVPASPPPLCSAAPGSVLSTVGWQWEARTNDSRQSACSIYAPPHITGDLHALRGGDA